MNKYLQNLSKGNKLPGWGRQAMEGVQCLETFVYTQIAFNMSAFFSPHHSEILVLLGNVIFPCLWSSAWIPGSWQRCWVCQRTDMEAEIVQSQSGVMKR
jgi:hypothetical protein